MGRGALVLLLSIGSAIMKVLWVTLVMVLVLAMVAEAKKKPKPKPKGKGKPSKPSKPSKCPADQIKANPKLLKKEFVKYTEMKRGKGGKLEPDATAPCWWDLTKTECAKCKEGGEQCGFPMHKWCQAKKPKKGPKTGCKGIPHYQFTNSSRGFPCYWDHNDLSCAWCLPNRIQCKDDAKSQKCGSYCLKATDLKCDGILTTCENIPKCGYGAKCDSGKKCKCGKGLTGNGYQCFDAKTGEPAVNPAGNVDITIESESQFFVFPDGSSEFPNISG